MLEQVRFPPIEPIIDNPVYIPDANNFFMCVYIPVHVMYMQSYFLLAAEEDLGKVYPAIFSLADRWRDLFICLGIPMSILNDIEKIRRGYGHDCLSDGLYEWLKRRHNTDKYGIPSWRTLIKHVDKIDCALARDLAKKHEGNLCTMLIIILL